jgi:hypothetical protein
VQYYGQSTSQGALVAGYTLLQASVAWQITKTYLLVARCDDILNEAPETRPDVFMAGRTFSGVLQGQWQ